MADSVTASDIPAGFELVAGYVDGRYKWSDADWALFPDKVKVRISVLGNDADVLDVETGAAYPTMAPSWANRQRAVGRLPTVYVNLSNVDQVRAAFATAGEPPPNYWLAHYDNDATLPDGYIAKQYANAALTGGHYDASVVADFWPGVDKPMVKVPQYAGQSVVEQDAKVGDVVVVDGIYDYGQGPRHIVRKFIATTPGVWPITLHPPVDPDADATEVLDARPSIFVVVVNA